MNESILCQVVCRIRIAGELAHEISHLRLVAAHQLAKGRSILLRHDSRDEIAVIHSILVRLKPSRPDFRSAT